MAWVLVAAAPAMLGQPDKFVSLSPVAELSEYWTVEGSAPDTWSVKDRVIVCTGKPNGFLRSKKTYRNFIFRAEWRFQKEGWAQKPPKYPNAGYFIHARAVEDDWPKSLARISHQGGWT